ncbi:glycosyltransferase family 4 protein [Bacillus sonorensis]|uniref:glycosyltransferase family 4 protein n=1 Tax=Bacillus sonorensis TaxID=119858 RepID=UPI00227F268A|nr:glycosyltransferase family 4 protein [Bacillus sonorensis]MCZ0068651.1 glycosyltransferase family 4 protein [Bacillus sonorensis]MCZ0095046.1 glycosyltransferase family 4 protein [Bacillus sonorensis]MDR4957890.1 glycosyltransferase family 4 protein [Bacillus sonorensis]MEC1518376.1 glycosyltransferase family 4 protein [Bacillus sonorensis]
MTGTVLFCATVDYHFKAFHLPYFKWFKEQGWNVHTAAKGSMQLPFADQQFDIGIERSPFRSGNLKACRELGRIIDENEYNIIHCHTPMGGVLARLAARKWRKKGTAVIYTAHGFHFCQGAPLKNWLLYYPIEKGLSFLTDCLITINQEDFELAKGFRRMMRTEKIHGIGVDTGRFHPVDEEEKRRLRTKYDLNQDDFVLIYPAELNINKNQALLIEATALLKDRMPNMRLVFAGKGQMEEEYRRLAEQKRAASHITFAGFQKDIHEWIKLADVSVASSRREGLGMNLLEGMAAGKPAVATDNRGHREVIKDGVNGFLIPQGDAQTFSERLLQLYHSDRLQKQMGEEGRKTAAVYSQQRTVKEMAGIYSSFMKKQAAERRLEG